MHVDAAAAFTGDRAGDHVDDPHHAPALALDLLDSGQRLEGFPGLAHRDVKRVALDHRVAIAELGGGLRMRRQTRQLLDQVCAYGTRDMGGAAAENLDVPNLEQLSGGQFDAAQMRGLETRLDTPA